MAEAPVIKVIDHPELGKLLEGLHSARQVKKAAEQMEGQLKGEVEAILQELPPADRYQVARLELHPQYRKGRETVDRVLLLEQGVEPEKVDQATRTGKGYLVLLVNSLEEE